MTKRCVALILGIAVLAAGFVTWHYTKQTPVERIQNEAQVAGQNLILLRSTKGWMWRDLWLRTVSKYRHDPEGYYLKVIANAQSNLLSLKILEKRSFEFQRLTNSYSDFNLAIHEAFDREGFLWACEFRTPTSILVTARPDQMSRWEKLVRRFDSVPEDSRVRIERTESQRGLNVLE